MGWKPVAGSTFDMAVHAILVPGGTMGRILYFGGYDVYDTHLYDIASDSHTKTFQQSESPEGLSPNPHGFDTRRYDLFCCGHAFLEDGRILCGGGELNRNSKTKLALPEDELNALALHHQHGGMQYGGERQCAIYHPLSEKWVMAKPMNLDPAGNAYSGGRWYPTLTTLPNGEILSVGGHMDRNENYTRNGSRRHSNNTPERYNPSSNEWTLLASDPPTDDQLTSEFGEQQYDYQRNHVLPNGDVFFSSEVRGKNRIYNPYVGVFLNDSNKIFDMPTESFYRRISAQFTSVLLPLLPNEGYRPRVLLFGGKISYRIDLGSGSLGWQETPVRDSWGTEHSHAPERSWVIPILLPTGEVFFTGGTAATGKTATKTGDENATDNAVLRAEFYDPKIDWGNGAYLAGTGDWATQAVADQSTVRRQYHATALLMPNGAVWTAGSNGPSSVDNGREKRMEIFEPWYFEGANQQERPEVTLSPRNVSYAFGFDVDVTFGSGNSIERVAFTRCGSCTHGYNPDQRYIDAKFNVATQLPGNAVRLTVFAPPNSNIAPPGYYLLWVIDDQGRPCKVAPFIRISNQKCYITEDISTYSIHEVQALGTPAVFAQACYVVFDAFLPDEVDEPTIQFLTLEGNVISGINYGIGAVEYESSAQDKDVAQRIAYPVHITFTSTTPFDLIPNNNDFMDIVIQARMGHAFCDAKLTLSLQPNPRMSDGHPHWLSTDVRVFKLKAGDSTSFSAGLNHPAETTSAPFNFITDLIHEYNTWEPSPGDTDHPFGLIPTGHESNQLALYGEDDNGNKLYNYAVAKVRYVAPENIDASGVSVFFRLWTTGWTALNYSDPKHASKGSYRRVGDGPSARPLLGIDGGEINNVPCFAQSRASDMANQADALNWNKTIKGTGAETHQYFGCWLDNNTDTPRFPLEPGGGTSFNGDLKSIQELTRGPHQCLVAEIHFPPDPIPLNSTPSSTDDLSQRNILFDEVPNPGGLASRVAHHTFEVKASPHALPLETNTGGTLTAVSHRLHADELAIHWGNLPLDSIVTLYVPQWDMDDVLRYASQRAAPKNLFKGNNNTIQTKVSGGVTYVPVPGPSAKNMAALFTVQLPPHITKGDRYSIVVRQIDGRRTRVVGTTQFDILVKTENEIRPGLLRKFSVLKHIALSIPVGNRWHPIFERYLNEMGDRVRTTGIDPESVEPSSTGSGTTVDRPDPDKPCEETGMEGRCICINGYVSSLHYDCCGGFEGFTLCDCNEERFIPSLRCSLEQVALTAYREHIKVTVHALLKSQCVNNVCPWSNQSVKMEATTTYRGQSVGFCSTQHRDKFASAIRQFDTAISSLREGTSRATTVNHTCPWSGKPVAENAVAHYKNYQVGFCSQSHRNLFIQAMEYFDRAIANRCDNEKMPLVVQKIVLG